MLYINCRRIESNIDSVIADIINKKKLKLNVHAMDMSHNTYMTIKNNKDHCNLDTLTFQIIRIRSWVDSVYSLILL